MALNTKFQRIATEELGKAAARIGRRILNLYLADLSAARALELSRDTGFLNEIVERAVGDAVERARMEGRDTTNPSSIVPTTRYQASTLTRDIIALVDSAVRSAPTLTGITLDDACATIKRKLARRYTSQSLRALLRRNVEFHTLMVRQGRIRLRSELIVEAIARNRAQNRSLKVTEKPSPTPRPRPIIAAKTRPPRR